MRRSHRGRGSLLTFVVFAALFVFNRVTDAGLGVWVFAGAILLTGVAQWVYRAVTKRRRGARAGTPTRPAHSGGDRTRAPSGSRPGAPPSGEPREAATPGAPPRRPPPGAPAGPAGGASEEPPVDDDPLVQMARTYLADGGAQVRQAWQRRDGDAVVRSLTDLEALAAEIIDQLDATGGTESPPRARAIDDAGTVRELAGGCLSAWAGRDGGPDWDTEQSDETVAVQDIIAYTTAGSSRR